MLPRTQFAVNGEKTLRMTSQALNRALVRVLPACIVGLRTKSVRAKKRKRKHTPTSVDPEVITID